MKKDKSPDPLNVGFFGSNTIMPDSNSLTDLVQQARFCDRVNAFVLYVNGTSSKCRFFIVIDIKNITISMPMRVVASVVDSNSFLHRICIE